MKNKLPTRPLLLVLALMLATPIVFALDRKTQKEFAGKYKGRHEVMGFESASGRGTVRMPRGKGKAKYRGSGDTITWFDARVTRVSGNRKRVRYRGIATFPDEDETGPFRATAQKKGRRKVLSTSWGIPAFDIDGSFSGKKKG